MKAFRYIIVICFILGIGLLVAAFLSGTGLAEVRAIFDDSDQYSDVLIHEFDTTANTIHMDMEDRHIEFVYSDVSFVTIHYRKHELDAWTFDLEDSAISITQEKENKWRFLNFGFASRTFKEVIVYLPLGTTYDFDISTDVGSIELLFESNIRVGDLKLESDTGSIRLKNITISGDFELESGTGSIVIEDIIGNDLEVSLSTGSFEAKNFTLSTLDIETSTGNVKLNQGEISSTLKAHVSTGEIDINLVQASSFDLLSSTGDITLTSNQSDQFYFDLSVSVGRIRVFNANQGTTYSTQSSVAHTILVKARTSTGNITIAAA